jgi:PAS domain-containing protein
MPQLPNTFSSPLLPILEDSSEGIAVAAPLPWRLIYVNPTLAEWLGVAPTDVLGRPIEDVFRAVGPFDLIAQFESVHCGQESHASFSHELVSACGSANAGGIRRLHRILADGGDPLVGVVVRKAAFRTTRSRERLPAGVIR